MYIMMLCIIYYNTCIFNTVLYTIMCMISINNNKDRTRVNIDDAIADVSSTMLHLLSLVSPTVNSSLSACMVGNIVTSMVTNRPTSLQIALSVLVSNYMILEPHHLMMKFFNSKHLQPMRLLKSKISEAYLTVV